MRALILLAVFLVGCDTLYYRKLPEGMVVNAYTYTDAQKLAKYCGRANACAYTDLKTYCDLHLPLAANGDVLYYDHEITHCWGRLDAPRVERGMHDPRNNK